MLNKKDSLKNGTLKYEVPDTEKIRNYTVKIYSNVKDCLNDELRTLNLTTPMYNQISDWELCKNSNEYYCQTYVTSPITISEEEIMEKNINNNENNESETQNEVQNAMKKVWLWVGISVVVVLIAAIIFTIIRKNKKDLI